MPRSPGRSGYRWRQLRKRLRKPGVVCWICGHPIDLDLAWPDRWSFTVHHIVPLARGGDPLAEDNAVPAHLSCNSRLGDGTKAVVPRTSRLW